MDDDKARQLIEQWRAQVHAYAGGHHPLATGFRACADDLERVLASETAPIVGMRRPVAQPLSAGLWTTETLLWLIPFGLFGLVCWIAAHWNPYR